MTEQTTTRARPRRVDDRPESSHGSHDVKQRIGTWGLRLTRWGVEGQPPEARRYVAIAAPHTTNWDLPYLLLHAWHHGLSISWLGKDTLFRWPVGPVLRRLGGMPVARGSRSGLVRTLADRFAAAELHDEQLVLVIPPEGTRRASDHWKSGFYEIARAAEVPIVCIFLDYERRVGGFGPTVLATGDIDADLDGIRRFVEQVRGKYPDQASAVVVRPQSGDGSPD